MRTGGGGVRGYMGRSVYTEVSWQGTHSDDPAVFLEVTGTTRPVSSSKSERRCSVVTDIGSSESFRTSS
jgi:hypothetical protein